MKVETFLIKKLDRKHNYLIRIFYGNDAFTETHHGLIEYYLKNQLKNIFKRKIACISIDEGYDIDEHKKILIKIITKDYE